MAKDCAVKRTAIASLFTITNFPLAITGPHYAKSMRANLIDPSDSYTSSIQTFYGPACVRITSAGLSLLDFEMGAKARKEASEPPIWAQRQIGAITAALNGELSHSSIGLDLTGTDFQIRVWNYLRTIPFGETCSYQAVAKGIGQPLAVRAVASACAKNPIAIIIPCHRVIRIDGTLGGFKWGLPLKERILRAENSAYNHQTGAHSNLHLVQS